MTEIAVFVMDADPAFSADVSSHFEANGLLAECFADGRAFLAALRQRRPGCIILDVEAKEMHGVDMQRHLCDQGYCIPQILVAREADAPAVVLAMRRGAHDFMVKPVPMDYLLAQTRAAIESARQRSAADLRRQEMLQRLCTLTDRENEILTLALTGKSNKEISEALDISHRTVETHRSHILEKIGISNLLEVAHAFSSIDDYLDADLRNAEDDDEIENA